MPLAVDALLEFLFGRDFERREARDRAWLPLAVFVLALLVLVRLCVATNKHSGATREASMCGRLSVVMNRARRNRPRRSAALRRL